MTGGGWSRILNISQSTIMLGHLMQQLHGVSAECALEIRSHSDCHSTMTGGGRHAIEHGFESPKHRVSLGLSMNSYVHRKQYTQAQ